MAEQTTPAAAPEADSAASAPAAEAAPAQTAEPQAEVADMPVEVHEAELPQAVESPTASAGGQLDILLDTTMAIAVNLGGAEIAVRELLQMGPGSVFRLDKKAGEPVDLYLRGVKFATGYLVVVGEQLGVRIKEIVPSPKA